MTVDAFPLHWPQGWVRAKRRERGAFKVTFARARDELMAEISRMGGRLPVLSSNLMLRRDGLPYAQQTRIEDPGIAVYFTYRDKQMCFACDRYTTIEANARAIQLSIAAIRGLERWGASDMMERAFTGFAQLAGPMDVRQWWEVLGVDSTARGAGITGQYRVLRSLHHPDKGGEPSEFQAVQAAYDQACAEGYV